VTRPRVGGTSLEAAQGPRGGLARRPLLKHKPLVGEAGDEGRTAAEPFDALAASSPYRQGPLPRHHLLSKICDTTLMSAARPYVGYVDLKEREHHVLERQL